MGITSETAKIALLTVIAFFMFTLSPIGQPYFDSSGSTQQGILSSIDQNTAGVNSDTDQLSNLLETSTFTSENFAQEDTLSNVESNTASIHSDTSKIDTNTGNIDNTLTKAKGLFGGLDVNNRQNLFHIEATVPLNNRRNDWNGTVTWTGSTYQLNGTGFIDSSQRGEYQPGSTSEFGLAVLFNNLPDENDNDRVKWGYYNREDGVYYGVNSTCKFVGIEKEGKVLSEVCQSNWNVDTLDGSGDSDNPSGKKLDLKDVNMYQSQFAWYGGGILEMGVVLDDVENGQEYFVMHRFDIDNQTSLGQVSLPISLDVENDADNDVSVEVAGRQYSILDNYEKTARQTKEFRESVTASATEYTPAVSFQVEDGYENVNLDLLSFSATPQCDVNAHIRYDTNLTGANFTEPNLIENANESLILSDVDATSWQDSDGDPSGFYLDFGQLSGGQNTNKDVASVQSEKVSAVIGANEIVTLAFKADDTSCDVNDITVQTEEDY